MQFFNVLTFLFVGSTLASEVPAQENPLSLVDEERVWILSAKPLELQLTVLEMWEKVLRMW
jgi:hypothetical protein